LLGWLIDKVEGTVVRAGSAGGGGFVGSGKGGRIIIESSYYDIIIYMSLVRGWMMGLGLLGFYVSYCTGLVKEWAHRGGCTGGIIG